MADHGDLKKIPTLLLTGFLGAGKTTLLNRLIPYYQSVRTVLLINEFGQVGIDGQLLAAGNYQKIELNKGSLFCICVRTDFIDEVERIATEIRPDLLLIEATGLADTTDLEKMLALPNLRDAIDLHACVCLVDCQNFLKIAGLLNAPISQVRSADVVILNKTDLVPTEEVQEVINAVRDIAPHVPLLQTTFCQFPLDTLEKIRRSEVAVSDAPGDGRPDPVESFTFTGDGSFSPQLWEEFVALARPHCLRAKGFIAIARQSYYVDATLDTWTVHAAERTEPNVQQLVVIGQRLPYQQLNYLFSQTLEQQK